MVTALVRGGHGGQGGGGAGLGGAIFTRNGNVTVINSQFVSNSVSGGTGFINGQGAGGAIFNLGANLAISGLTFQNNSGQILPDLFSFGGTTTTIAPPIASIAIQPSVIAENSGFVVPATIRLNKAALTDIDVNYTVSGNATLGRDFLPLSGRVKILEGQNAINIPITILDDQLFDPNESLTLTLASGTGYTLGFSGLSATLAIADNEQGGPTDSQRLCPGKSR